MSSTKPAARTEETSAEAAAKDTTAASTATSETAASSSFKEKMQCQNPKCSNSGTKRCSQCRAVSYCGQKCQRAVWNSHKALCKAMAKQPEATCLLLDGMGPLGPRNFYTEGVSAALDAAGIKFVTVNLTKTSLEQVGSVLLEAAAGRFTSCIALGVGSGGTDIEKQFGDSAVFRDRVVSWVNGGGRFLVQGERAQQFGNWPTWFGKDWKSDDYRRTQHVCHAKSDEDVHWCKWYHKSQGSITGDINVKAVMMRDVPPEERLFGTVSGSVSHSPVPFMAGLDVEEGLCAVALGKFGNGAVGFFGDVNAEDETCQIMAVVARGPQ